MTATGDYEDQPPPPEHWFAAVLRRRTARNQELIDRLLRKRSTADSNTPPTPEGEST